MTGAFETGVYRNLFLEYGYDSKEIQRRLENCFQTMFYGSDEERIYHVTGDDMGYVEDTGNHDVRTEGMSYAMMVCVQLDKKEEFEPALREALAAGGPVLIDCRIGADDKVFPMVPAGEDIQKAFDQDDLKEN